MAARKARGRTCSERSKRAFGPGRPRPPWTPWLRRVTNFRVCALFTKSVVAHMEDREFAARKEPPGEGKDLLDVHCITLKG